MSITLSKTLRIIVLVFLFLGLAKTAISCVDLIRNDTTLGTFATVQAAVDDTGAGDDDTIQITAAHFDEDVVYNQDTILNLSGGYDCGFSDNPSTSSTNSLSIINGTIVVDNIVIGALESPTTVTSAGQVWMDRNLGASRVATIIDDTEAYGDLYQWGRLADGHEKRTSLTTATLSTTDTPGHGDFITTNTPPDDWISTQNDLLWQGVDGTNNPCPAGFRLPTEAEIVIEQLSWSTNDRAGAFASPLKLVSAGGRDYSDGSIGSAGSYGYIWSSTDDGSLARLLYFGSGEADVISGSRAYGFSVRCIED